MDKGSLTFSAGWYGLALSAVIIAVRAFQPNAEPMSSWSVWSWALMLLPVYWPMVVLVAFLLLKLIVIAFEGPHRSKW
jgi:hypothetical protein